MGTSVFWRGNISSDIFIRMTDTSSPVKHWEPQRHLLELSADGSPETLKTHASSCHEFAGFKGPLQNPPAKPLPQVEMPV